MLDNRLNHVDNLLRKVYDALQTIHKWNEDILVHVDKRIDIINRRIMNTNRNVAKLIRLNSKNGKSKSVSFESKEVVKEQREPFGIIQGPCKAIIKPYHIPLTPIPHPSTVSIVSPEKVNISDNFYHS